MAHASRGALVGTIILALLGLIGSQALFGIWMVENHFDMMGGWIEGATASTFGSGFFVDLLFSGLIVTWLAIWSRRTVGLGWCLAVIAATWVGGVCIGLALWCLAHNLTTPEGHHAP